MAVAAALLMVPLVAMRFTDEVKWDMRDFIIAGVLLFGTGILLEVAPRMVQGFWLRIAVTGAILLALFLIWAELAVGIFGSPIAGS